MASSSPSQPEPRNSARLRQHFSVSSTDHNSKWDALWQEGYVPWDKGLPSPALVDLLAGQWGTQIRRVRAAEEDGPRLRALVPGCGKGYDVLLLAAWGIDAYGLDVSRTAVEEARAEEKRLLGGQLGNVIDGVYASKEGVRSRGKSTFIVGDFFNDEFLAYVEGGKPDTGEAFEGFDIIYDYTFSCALPPSLRPAWAERMKQLLSPRGHLACLEFPTYKAHKLQGPPFAMPPKVYLAHLQRPGQQLAYDDESGLLEEQLGAPAKDGLVQIAHFQPERGHKAAYDDDGKMTDWIGIWTHRSQ